ncbi:MAG: AmmeMemoRadiSam system radical SAM enzyme [Thermoleophilia bacterium]
MPAGSAGLHEARLWEVWRGGPTVHCFLCAHHCRIDTGERGLCGVRENVEGALYTYTYDCVITGAVDPIEKKPLFHFLPGTTSFSIATVGCNFTCRFCQNADISQMPRDRGEIRGRRIPPHQVVHEAVAAGCESIAYTYTEPTIYFEYAADCASLAKQEGLKNVFVTNGYMTKEALAALDGRLDAANVDLKSFSDDFYRKIVGARLRPVLESIRRLHAMGVWLEVTTLLIPGRNDSDEELRALAGFLVSVDPDIPWHVSRFHPTYQMMDIGPTPQRAVERALEIGRDEGLRYIYAGNLPGHDSESTYCPSCGHRVIERRGYWIQTVDLEDGSCARCGYRLPVVGKSGRKAGSSGRSGEGSADGDSGRREVAD